MLVLIIRVYQLYNSICESVFCFKIFTENFREIFLIVACLFVLGLVFRLYLTFLFFFTLTKFVVVPNFKITIIVICKHISGSRLMNELAQINIIYQFMVHV